MKGIYMVIPLYKLRIFAIPLYKLRIFAYLFRIVYELPQQHNFTLQFPGKSLHNITISRKISILNLLSGISHVNSHIHDLNYLNTHQPQNHQFLKTTKIISIFLFPHKNTQIFYNFLKKL